MAVNQQQRGLLKIVPPTGAMATPAPAQVRTGIHNVPDMGMQSAAHQTGAAYGSIADDLAKLGKEIGGYADHAAKVEGEREGHLAGLDPEFRPRGDITIRGEAFDRAALETYKTRAKIEIEDDIAKGGDLEAKKRAWQAQAPEELLPEIDHMFRRGALVKAREASREVAAQVSAEAKTAQQAEIDAMIRGMHQRSSALGLDGAADGVLSKDFELLGGTLRRAGADGKPLLSPDAIYKIETYARQTVTDARLLGAFQRLPSLEAQQQFVDKLREDFHGSKGIAAIYDFQGFQRVTRQLEQQMRSAHNERATQQAAVAEDIKAATRLAEQGYSITPEQLAGLRARAASDPATGSEIDQLQELANWQAAARGWHPDQIQAYADDLRAQMRVRGANKAAADRVQLAERLAATAREQLRADPLGWAERSGQMKIAPLQLDSPEASQASFRARMAQAEHMAKIYGQEPVYLRPAERRMLAHAASQGGAQMIGIAEGITRAAGDKAHKVLGEVFNEAPVVAMLGGHVAAVGRTGTADDVADGIALQRTDGFKGIAPSVREAREQSLATHGAALGRLPQTEAAAIGAANAAYEVRARRRGLTEFDEKLWQQTFREVMGERTIDGVTFGGFTRHREQMIAVPANVRQRGVGDLIEALRPEDFGEAPPAYKDGRAASIGDLRRARLVSVGEGQYWLNLGSETQPQYLWSAPGENFVLDLKAMEPVLRERRPDLYFGGEKLPPPGVIRQRRAGAALRGADEDVIENPSWRSMIRSFAGIPMNYEGARESTNVEDRRGEPPEAPTEQRAIDDFLPRTDNEAAEMRANVERLRGQLADPDANIDRPKVEEWVEQAEAGLAAWDGQGTPKQTRDAVRRRMRRMGPLDPSMMRLGGPQDDDRLGDYRPRFARPGNDDLTATGAQTVQNWKGVLEPYTKAFDVFSRALDAAMGKGEGVTDDEVREAGQVLAGLAFTGSLAATRPADALGAGGRVVWTGAMLKKVQGLRGQGLSASQIADELGVPAHSVENAVKYHKLPASEARLSPADEAKLVLMYREGAQTKVMAEVLDVDERTVARVARRLGLEARQGGRPGFDDTIRAEVLKRVGEGQSKDEVAARFGVSRRTINLWLNQEGGGPMRLGGDVDAPEMDARGSDVPKPEIGPTAGLPPQLGSALNDLASRRKLTDQQRKKLDDLLFTDHFLAGVDAIESAPDERSRQRLIKRLTDELERALGKGH